MKTFHDLTIAELLALKVIALDTCESFTNHIRHKTPNPEYTLEEMKIELEKHSKFLDILNERIEFVYMKFMNSESR
jgi:hypothetical protein